MTTHTGLHSELLLPAGTYHSWPCRSDCLAATSIPPHRSKCRSLQCWYRTGCRSHTHCTHQSLIHRSQKGQVKIYKFEFQCNHIYHREATFSISISTANNKRFSLILYLIISLCFYRLNSCFIKAAIFFTKPKDLHILLIARVTSFPVPLNPAKKKFRMNAAIKCDPLYVVDKLYIYIYCVYNYILCMQIKSHLLQSVNGQPVLTTTHLYMFFHQG